MMGLGLGISFVGYWVMYYGITQVQGGNWGFLDLGLPSRLGDLSAIPKDDGSTLTGKATATGLAQVAKNLGSNLGAAGPQGAKAAPKPTGPVGPYGQKAGT